MYNKNTNKGTKNAFEVRLEVLKMAQSMVEQSYNEANNMAWSMVENTAKYQEKAMEDLKDYYESIKPAMYTPEDIVKKASELYEFVTKKEDK